jgi:phosphohistidine phosphatase
LNAKETNHNTSLSSRLLIIGRHGEKKDDPFLPDWERPLTRAGILQCRVNGNSLMSQGIRPDYLLCSSSPRTIHSLETLISQIMYGDDNVPETHTCGTELYNAYDADMMIDVLTNHVPDVSLCPLVVGHNPGMHRLAHYLAQKSKPHLVFQIEGGFPSSSMCIFRVTCEKWSEISPQNCELLYVLCGSDQ